MYLYICVCHSVCVWKSQDGCVTASVLVACGFSRAELSSLGLLASSLAHWAVSPALGTFKVRFQLRCLLLTKKK